MPIATRAPAPAARIALLALPALLACRIDATPTDDAPEDTAAHDSADSEVECPEAPGPGPKDTGDGPRTARAMTGTIAWHVDFDADAEAAGYVDCDYHRDYNTLVERTDLGYLCPACTLLVQGLAEMPDADTACYAQISDSDGTRVEQLGLGTGSDGAEALWRSGSTNITLAEAGPWGDGAAAFGDTGTLDDGAVFTLTAQAALTVADTDQTVDDPEGARTEPYACGWPLYSPGGPNPTHTAALGQLLPNARLLDACGERVDLWDFRGRYVIIDASSPDCGPCQEMARRAEDFRAHMAEQCVDVELITLLNAGLSDVNLAAQPLAVEEWIQAFNLTSPVLADEGYGYAVLAPAIRPEGGMSLPSVAVLDPDGVVLYLDSGFGETSGYFDPIEQVILADVAAR